MCVCMLNLHELIVPSRGSEILCSTTIWSCDQYRKSRLTLHPNRNYNAQLYTTLKLKLNLISKKLHINWQFNQSWFSNRFVISIYCYLTITLGLLICLLLLKLDLNWILKACNCYLIDNLFKIYYCDWNNNDEFDFFL